MESLSFNIFSLTEISKMLRDWFNKKKPGGTHEQKRDATDDLDRSSPKDGIFT